MFHHDQVEKCTYFESESEREREQASTSNTTKRERERERERKKGRKLLHLSAEIKGKHLSSPLLSSAISSSSLYLLTCKSSVWHSCVIQYKCQGYNESTRYERPLLLLSSSCLFSSPLCLPPPPPPPQSLVMPMPTWQVTSVPLEKEKKVSAEALQSR